MQLYYNTYRLQVIVCHINLLAAWSCDQNAMAQVSGRLLTPPAALAVTESNVKALNSTDIEV